MKEEKIYLWLSQCVNMDYCTYINLCKIFKNVFELYNLSKNKDKFFKYLNLNNVYINYIIYLNLIDPVLKEKSEVFYSKLNKENIKILTINSKNYPINLKNVFNPPLLLFIYGDKSILNKNKIMVYSGIKDSCIYNDFCNYLIYKDIAIVDYNLNVFTNILYLPYMQKIDRENLLVISDKIEKNSYINYDNITGVSDILLVTEASYNIKIGVIVDMFLEQGKDVLVVPGSIYNKDVYFSNYLIKSGSACITTKKDIDFYLK
ncbi:MAG: hypothetical protein RR144_03375 [Clostridia bacterium]